MKADSFRLAAYPTSRVTVAALVSMLSSFTATGCAAELRAEPGEELGGGATTNRTIFGDQAFAQAIPTLDASRQGAFATGNALFDLIWLTAPAPRESRDGLGPTFNSASCSGCHVNDGRGRPPVAGEATMTSMLVRLSIPGVDAHGGPLDEPAYGGQFQPSSIDGVPGEGAAELVYTETAGAYDDGTPYSLRKPTVVFTSLAFGPMQPGTLTSARVAPVMIGLGLLELVRESELLALSDPDDGDGDGISGRVNRVWDVRAGGLAVGRFGWKAGQPNVRQQSAGAFGSDMGLSTTEFPSQNCPPVQVDCAAATTGGEPEVSAQLMDRVALYGRTLAVPARVNADDRRVLEGREWFREIGCPSCHVEHFTTGASADIPELSGQSIRPFTDLLLHDMGAGLADGRPEFDASGTEWRTPPLWGLGRVDEVNHHSFLLHDGRARGIAEAILWHDGEGAAARDAFRALSTRDRESLVRFLESL